LTFWSCPFTATFLEKKKKKKKRNENPSKNFVDDLKGKEIINESLLTIKIKT